MLKLVPHTEEMQAGPADPNKADDFVDDFIDIFCQKAF